MRFLLLLTLAAGLAAGEASLRLLSSTPVAGERLDFAVLDAPAAWVQADVARTPTLLIVPPEGPTVTRRAFLYQEHQPTGAAEGPAFAATGPVGLRIRHTARVAGTHRWTLYAPESGAIAAGSFTVAAATAPVGPLRLHRDTPRLPTFADGTPFVAIGPNVAWAEGANRVAAFEHLFTAMQANGCTHTRVWFASWCGQVQGDAPDALRLDHAWLMDRVLELARQHGLRLTLVLDNFHDIHHGKCAPWGATADERVRAFTDPALPAAYRRRVAYVMARYGADDTILAWEPMNEIDMLVPERERALPWAQAALGLIGELDADHRLRTLSWAGDDVEVAMALPGVDIAQIRGYVLEWEANADLLLIEKTRDGVGMLLEPVAKMHRLGRPFLIAEVGYQGSNEVNPGNDRDTDGFLLRQQAWAGLLLGGCGSGMNWWWDHYIDKRDLWHVYRGLARTVAQVDWRDRELAPMQPNAGGAIRILGWVSPTQGLVWPQHRLDTWHARLVRELPRPMPSTPMPVGLPGFTRSAPYRIHVIDMTTGTARHAYEQAAGADGRLELVVPPGTIDTVYRIERIGDAVKPDKPDKPDKPKKPAKPKKP